MNRRGMSLLELLLSLVLISLLAAIAVPRVTGVLSTGERRLAREKVVRALDLTRGLAIRIGEPVHLIQQGDELHIFTTNGSTPIWTSPSPTQQGFNLSGLQRAVGFGPDGLGWGAANRTIVVSKAGASDRVILSRLGRLRHGLP